MHVGAGLFHSLEVKHLVVLDPSLLYPLSQENEATVSTWYLALTGVAPL